MPNNNQTRKIQELGQLFNGMDMSETTHIHNSYEAQIQMGDMNKIFAQIMGVATHPEKGVDTETVKSLCQSFGSVLEKSKDAQIAVHTSIHANKLAMKTQENTHKVEMVKAIGGLAKEAVAVFAAAIKTKPKVKAEE